MERKFSFSGVIMTFGIYTHTKQSSWTMYFHYCKNSITYKLQHILSYIIKQNIFNSPK